MSSPPNPPVLQLHSGIVLKGQLSLVRDVILTGKFEGDLQTFGRLTVASGGSVTGAIEAGALVLEPGNLVEARVKIGVQPLPMTPTESRQTTPSPWIGRLQKLKDFAFGRK